MRLPYSTPGVPLRLPLFGAFEVEDEVDFSPDDSDWSAIIERVKGKDGKMQKGLVSKTLVIGKLAIRNVCQQGKSADSQKIAYLC